jgi:hypothetical protein
VRERLTEFADGEVAVITFATPERAAAYQRARLAPLPVLIDQDRSAYGAYGLMRGSIRTVWGPKVWLAYAKLLTEGRRLERPTEDTRQLGGDFVIGRDGRLVSAFRSADPADRLDVDDLLDGVRRA